MSGSTLRSYEHGVAIGVAADPTSFTSRSIAKKWLPVDPGGLQMEGGGQSEDIPTEHSVPGIAYRAFTKRNDQAGTLNAPLFAERAGLQLKAAVERTVNGLPKSFEIYSRLSRSLAVAKSGHAASDFGSAKVGVVFTGFSLSFSRQQPSALRLNLTGIMNSDRAVRPASTTSSDNETAGANKTFTCASAALFNVGEYVTITAGATSAVSAETHITAISGNNITVANLSINADGSTTANTITKVRGTPAFPATSPGIYSSANLRVDFDYGSAGWSGDNRDVISGEVSYQAPAEAINFRANSNPELNGTWEDLVDELPTVTGSLVLRLTEDAYLDYKRHAEIPFGRARIMADRPNASGNTTTTASETAGSAVVVNVAATTGFSVGDVILLDDGTNQAVATITAISAGVSLTVDTLDVNIASGATVRNCAWEIKISRFDITGAPESQSGNFRVVTVSFSGTVLIGQAELLTVKAYDDDTI